MCISQQLQESEITTLGIEALTSDVYTEAVVRVPVAKLEEQQPGLVRAGATELNALKAESEAAPTPGWHRAEAEEGVDEAGGESAARSSQAENIAPPQPTSHTAPGLAYADFTSALRRFAVR